MRGDGAGRKKNWTTRETLVGVVTKAKASCSGEHVVPCLPSCLPACLSVSVRVCMWRSPAFQSLLPLYPPAHHCRPAPLFRSHLHLHFLLRFSFLVAPRDLPTARPRSLQRVAALWDEGSEWVSECVCWGGEVCVCVWERERKCEWVRVRTPARNRSISVNSPTSLFRHDAGSDPLPGRVSADPQSAAAATPDRLRWSPFRAGRLRGHQVHEGMGLFSHSPTPHPLPSPLTTPFQLPLPLPSRCAFPLQCASIPAVLVSFVAGLLCSGAARVCCHMLAVVGLYFCFGCTCSTRQLLSNLLCISFNIFMCKRDKLGMCTQLPTHEICPLLFLGERLLMNY